MGILLVLVIVFLFAGRSNFSVGRAISNLIKIALVVFVFVILWLLMDLFIFSFTLGPTVIRHMAH